MKKFFLVFLALTTAAFGQGSLGDYSKNLKIASSTATSISVGTSGTSIVITGSTIAFGTGAVTTTGTLQSITVSGLQMSGGSGTLTGILDGGTARNTVIQSANLGTGTTTGAGIIVGGSATMARFTVGTGTTSPTGSPPLYSFISSPTSGLGLVTTTIPSIYSSGTEIMRFESNQVSVHGGSGRIILQATALSQRSAGVVQVDTGTGGIVVGSGTTSSLALGTGGVTRVPYVIASSTAASLNLNNGPLQTLALATGTTTLTFSATGTNGRQVNFYCTAGTAGATLTLSGNAQLVPNPTTVSPSKTIIISADAIVITGTTPTIFTSWVQEL